MHKMFLLLMFSFSLVLNGQELVRKKKTGAIEQEIYFISKTDKMKNGPYVLLNNTNNDTLKSGQFRNDAPIGIWSYYSKENQLYLKFDYDSNQLLFESEKIEKVDSFYILANGEFIHDKVDSPPVFIGYDNEIRMALASSVKVPVNILQIGRSCASAFSIEIGTEGEITKYTIEQSADKNLDEQVIEVLKKYNKLWIPAKKDGKPVVSKIFMFVRIYLQTPDSPRVKDALPEKPYRWTVDITYFRVARTTTSSSSGNFPGSGGMRTK